jgi:pyruvate-formate lyase-activating enzyme
VNVGEPKDKTEEPLPGELVVMLFVTRRCNLACSYCHMAHEGIEDQQEERLLQAIDMAFASYDNAMLHFFGGEPLMRMDLVAAGVAHIEANYADRPHRKMVTTNGILLRGETLEYLLDHDVNLMLSLDGRFESQGAYRVALANNRKAYRAVIKSLKTLLDRNIPFFVNMCVSPGNVDLMFDNVAFLKQLGIRRMQIAYELGALWVLSDQNRYIHQFKRCISELQDENFHLQNHGGAEPVLGSSLATLDADGQIYTGASVVLEQSNPTFNAASFVGHIDTVKDFRGFVNPRIDVVRYFMKNTTDPADRERIRSCMHLGYRVKHEMAKLGHDC